MRLIWRQRLSSCESNYNNFGREPEYSVVTNPEEQAPPNTRLMEMENLIRYAPGAVGLMEMEH